MTVQPLDHCNRPLKFVSNFQASHGTQHTVVLELFTRVSSSRNSPVDGLRVMGFKPSTSSKSLRVLHDATYNTTGQSFVILTQMRCGCSFSPTPLSFSYLGETTGDSLISHLAVPQCTIHLFSTCKRSRSLSQLPDKILLNIALQLIAHR
jgi:hypothetical protein